MFSGKRLEVSEFRRTKWRIDPAKTGPGLSFVLDEAIALYLARHLTQPIEQGFPPHVFAPVVLSARLDDDLTRPEVWTFSNVLSFQDVLAKEGPPHLLGVPFYAPGRYQNPVGARHMSPIGWGKFNLSEITDPANFWYDPARRTICPGTTAISQ